MLHNRVFKGVHQIHGHIISSRQVISDSECNGHFILADYSENIREYIDP